MRKGGWGHYGGGQSAGRDPPSGSAALRVMSGIGWTWDFGGAGDWLLVVMENPACATDHPHMHLPLCACACTCKHCMCTSSCCACTTYHALCTTCMQHHTRTCTCTRTRAHTGTHTRVRSTHTRTGHRTQPGRGLPARITRQMTMCEPEMRAPEQGQAAAAGLLTHRN